MIGAAASRALGSVVVDGSGQRSILQARLRFGSKQCALG
jgi:hypothetical protein